MPLPHPAGRVLAGLYLRILVKFAGSVSLSSVKSDQESATTDKRHLQHCLLAHNQESHEQSFLCV